MNKKIIDPFLAFLPLFSTMLLIISSLSWSILLHTNGILAIFKFLLPVTKIFTIIGFIELTICLIILVKQKSLTSYINSISPTFYLHENLKIHAKISDYRNQNQQLSYAEKNYNSCVFYSYINLTHKNITVVITVPRNGEAQELLRKKVETLKNDLISRYSEYSFGGKFEQIGSFMILRGNHN